jgi:hypothetical protein
MDELLSLSTYAAESWGEAFPSVLERADQTFSRQQALFSDLVRQELDPAPERVPLLGECACRLSSALAGSSKLTRWRIGGSHLHMLANRLGLSNPEELYLGRLLTSTLQGFQASDLEVWSAAQDAFARRVALPKGDSSIADLLPRALEELGKAPHP